MRILACRNIQLLMQTAQFFGERPAQDCHKWCHTKRDSLNRRVPAAVECYESASGSLSKVGIVLETSAHNQNRKKMKQ